MLLDCIIRMWLLMPVENGSTWSLAACSLLSEVEIVTILAFFRLFKTLLSNKFGIFE